MIKTLSYTEVKKFHKELAQEMLEELRKSDSENSQTPIEKINWMYEFETIDGEIDIRRKSKDIDRSIRREKLLKLDQNLREEKKRKFTLFSTAFVWNKDKNSNDVISEEIKDFFSKIVTLSLVIKIGDYERFETVSKTALFESKIKEDMGILTF